jgi:hypothetical protein
LGCLRNDKGGEYMSRANRTLEEGVISMLYESGMAPSFWGEALAAFVHVHNRITTSALPDSTPYESFLGTKPDVSMLRVWGCTAYVLV